MELDARLLFADGLGGDEQGFEDAQHHVLVLHHDEARVEGGQVLEQIVVALEILGVAVGESLQLRQEEREDVLGKASERGG